MYFFKEREKSNQEKSNQSPLSLTTTIINLKNPNKLSKNIVLPVPRAV